MGYKRIQRYMDFMKNKGYSSRKIADELNLAGMRQPRTRLLFDAEAVEKSLYRR